jgi:hypothetical protein
VVLVGEVDYTLVVFGGEAWVRTGYVNRYWSAENPLLIREVALRHGCDWCMVLVQLVSLHVFFDTIKRTGQLHIFEHLSDYERTFASPPRQASAAAHHAGKFCELFTIFLMTISRRL